MDIESFLEHLHQNWAKRRWVTAWKHLSGKQPCFAAFPSGIKPELRKVLIKNGINRLFIHQAEAFRLASERKDFVVVTPTASGKTLCYNLPVLNEMLGDASKKTLMIFPTKALAHDQMSSVKSLVSDLDESIKVAAYDGDTPATERRSIRNVSSIVFTNPDMLHTGILPHHTKWQSFLSCLDTVVIDELHYYRGVFGSHLANLIRRLLRVCAFYGTSPRFILCSATIANPRELGRLLTGRPVRLIDRSGAPEGEKTFILYNPPVIDHEKQIRRSYLAESVEIAEIFIKQEIPTIIFCRSRMHVELLLRELKRRAEKYGMNNVIRGYRGGYLASERREIESALRKGEIRAIVATSALELGIDIGDLQVVIMAGYPGTIAAARQRSGRAGRRGNGSVSILIASSAQMDQYMIRNPEYFFSATPERGLINPNNMLVFLSHLRCSLAELPFKKGELFGDYAETGEFLLFLQEEKEAVMSGDVWYWTGESFPAANVSLRSASPDRYRVREFRDGAWKVVAEVDAMSVSFLLHPNAVYMHEGRQYLVKSLDELEKTADVEVCDSDYFTVPMEQSSVQIENIIETSSDVFPANTGAVQVVSRVIGYKEIRFTTLENIGQGAVEIPGVHLFTTGFWIHFAFDQTTFGVCYSSRDLAAGLAGALNAVHSAATVHLMCDPRDLGACISALNNEWSVQSNFLGSVDIAGPEQSITPDSHAHLFVFDRYPGGIGLCEHLYKIRKEVVFSAWKLVSECKCKFGCPGCIGPMVNGDNAKRIAATVLNRIYNGFIR